MPTALAVIGAVAAVVGTVGSLYYANKSLKLQKKASEKAAQQQDVQTRYANRQSIREMQIQRARATMSAAGSGSLFSSGVEGGIGGLTSQLGSALGYQTQYNSLSKDIGRLDSRANQASGMSNIFSGIASLGGSVYNASGGFNFGGGGGQSAPAAIPYTPTMSNWAAPAPNKAPLIFSRGHPIAGTSAYGGFI